MDTIVSEKIIAIGKSTENSVEFKEKAGTYPCPMMEEDERKKDDMVMDKSDSKRLASVCMCDKQTIKDLIPAGHSCNYIDEHGRIRCIPREIPGLIEAISQTQYFRWREKPITVDQIRKWIHGYYLSMF